MQANSNVVQILRHTLSRNGSVEIPSNGKSMYPLITQGNICRFVKAEEDTFKRGDILLFMTADGTLVAHRMHRRLVRDKEVFYICKGDSNIRPDEPVRPSQVLGRMEEIKKDRFTLRTDGGAARLWGWLMTRVPALSKCIQLFLRAKSRLRGQGFNRWRRI